MTNINTPGQIGKADIDLNHEFQDLAKQLVALGTQKEIPHWKFRLS